VAGVTATPLDLVVTEGNATSPGYRSSYRIVLTSQPLADVTVTVAVAAASARLVMVSPTTLRFNASTWATPVVVTVTSVDDDVDEVQVSMVHVNHTVASDDVVYAAVTRLPTVSVAVTDNDGSAVIVVVPDAGIQLNETLGDASTATFNVRLLSNPVADVVITPRGLGLGTQYTVSPASLTFTSADYSTPQTVTVERTPQAPRAGYT
jgi:nitrate reductase NapAB chaperone NapD